MERELAVVDLDALVRPVSKIKLDGKFYEVLPIQGAAVNVMEQIAADSKSGASDKSKNLERARQVVAAVVPSLEPERIKRLSLEQLAAIVQTSMQEVDKMRGVMAVSSGKGKGPATRKRVRTTGRS